MSGGFGHAGGIGDGTHFAHLSIHSDDQGEGTAASNQDRCYQDARHHLFCLWNWSEVRSRPKLFPMVRTSLAYTIFLIVQWIFFSSTVILFNKYLLAARGFHFPLTLVLCHMLFISACATLWKALRWLEVPEVAPRDMLTRFVPVGIFFGLSLGLGNAAYLYISVAFVQMLKATTPVAVLLISFIFGLEQPSVPLGGCIVLISTGICISCVSQIEISVVGTALQMAAVIAEALRLGLVNLLLTSKGVRFSPLAFLYYVAPLCALALLLPWAITELPELSKHRFAAMRHVGFGILLANASVAFFLNLATMALIKNTSALTLNVSGVFKDLLLIVFSVVVSGPPAATHYAVLPQENTSRQHHAQKVASSSTHLA